MVDESFFKIWSPKMAYVLGYMFADGAILDTNTSSRTYYLCFASNDLDLLRKRKLSGQFVAIKNKEVIAQGKDINLVIKQVEKKGENPFVNTFSFCCRDITGFLFQIAYALIYNNNALCLILSSFGKIQIR